ncbi:MAG: hypothetical protein COW24_03700 [Candidatus Kerfeldbacteria bacterium CG15_BIG_FIL_POST_REV_8_21_14_020_45_12]|uniref:Nucleotide pyrophosphatase n=1 Tax=Candidatus Kerfeldbacteria bacterium CG15_BIG_FIL_POST_REV_8_21_14_020_45_12 TaxID=2014247 RepID=A0A2M7H3F9_9BACT|nr:MAG: hypothetical protein COW24_03700 [Candidatus Kerfeldbacteria bacterium CG15_BIG_FIL_POST_REV_8_21_14_020_45_12]PJA93804.1 MAG: hypothetical protein CO132_01305 [Candidatus Kerfeldbacteria bacterium CG_4_9_14_3_um_filter_45_8]
MKKKTVVLGLDGATWKILKPFAEAGYMPTLKGLLERGVHGELESTMPAMTAPAWVTFATGKHPGNHGVFDFMLPTDSLGKMKFATAKDIRDKTLYEILKDEGYTPILVNLPATWPPKRDDIITITSLLTQGDQWVYPASLKEEFPELAKYRLTPDESLRVAERRDEYIVDLLAHLEEQMAAVRRLFTEKPWDFFFYLFSHSDWISHLAYTELEEEHEPKARAIFERIDQHLKWFTENIPADTNLILLSDHGFTAYKKVFYFNRWLEQEGYLKTNKEGDKMRGAATRRAKESDKITATKKRVNIGTGLLRFLDTFPFLKPVAKWSYHSVIKKYLPINLKVNVGIDFPNTKVCFPKGSYITNGYINKNWVYTDGCISREEYPKLVEELAEKIRNIKDPSGNPVVAKVMTRKEVYGDTAPDEAPDIFFELSDYWLIGNFNSSSLFDEEIENKHGKMGIFLAVGPDFETDADVEGLKMQDVTPTILHLLGLPVPEDCDGQVAHALFKAGSEPRERSVNFGAPSRLDDKPSESSEKTSLAKAIGKIKL